MIGKLDQTNRKVSVIGGGVSGLLAAYRLDQLGYEVSLFEAGPRLGGLISTETREFGIAETAAHSLLATPEVEKLFKELGVELLAVRENSKARFIIRNQKLRRFPLSIFETIGLIYRIFTKKSAVILDRLSDWAKFYLGEAAHDYLLSPFLIGVYGALTHEMSVKAAFPKLVVPENKTFFKSIFKKSGPKKEKVKKAMSSPRGGMGQFTDALAQKVSQRLGNRVYLNKPISELPNGQNIVLCVPTLEAARLIEKEDPHSATALRDVRYAPLVCCTVIVDRSVHKPLKGVGFLIPPKEQRPILGVLFNSSAFQGRVFDEPKYASYTVMIGGTLAPEKLKLSDFEIRSLIEEEFRYFFNLKGELSDLRIVRWERAVPVYGSELYQAWESLQQGWASKPGHVVFGNYAGQVSLRGMIEDVLSDSLFVEASVS